MSARASFYLLPVKAFLKLRTLLPPGDPSAIRIVSLVDDKELEQRKSLISPFDALRPHKTVYEYDWAGWVMEFVFSFLQESRGIDLSNAKIDSNVDVYALTNVDKQNYLNQLVPSNFSKTELKEWMSQQPEDFPDSEEALFDGLTGLYKCLEQVNDRLVFVLLIRC